MINLYVGHDERENVGTHVFVQSVLDRTTVPVSITALHKPMLRRAFGSDVREGTNAFTLSRFLIPLLQDYRGTAIFCDGADMLLKADLADLERLRDPYKAVQVVKHHYRTNSPRKYIGTAMEADNEDYPRKNWASVMLINCAHYVWRKMNPSIVRDGNALETLTFSWCPDQFIGELPLDWNWLADEYGASGAAKLLHWTQGIPLFPHYANAPHADEYRTTHAKVNYATN
jgi:hypothetical protein